MVESFSLLGNSDAKILILGSMPGVRSLEQQQYYAHPQNAFWRIIAHLFNQGKALEYQQGEALLIERGIALWDVLKFCDRQGSLDSAINKETMEMNNFVDLFLASPKLKYVFFNGLMAESTYKKQVWPLVAESASYIKYKKLPSTSPAYAAMKFEAKLAAWHAIKI